MLAAPVAVRSGSASCRSARPGSCPGPVWAAEYALEYGTAEIEVQRDAFAAGRRVLVLDDVLATGGTAEATCELVERAGAEVVELAVLLELSFLNGRDKLPGRPVHALLTI